MMMTVVSDTRRKKEGSIKYKMHLCWLMDFGFFNLLYTCMSRRKKKRYFVLEFDIQTWVLDKKRCSFVQTVYRQWKHQSVNVNIDKTTKHDHTKKKNKSSSQSLYNHIWNVTKMLFKKEVMKEKCIQMLLFTRITATTATTPLLHLETVLW